MRKLPRTCLIPSDDLNESSSTPNDLLISRKTCGRAHRASQRDFKKTGGRAMAAMYLRGIDLEDDLALRGRQLDLLLGLKVGCPQQSMRANGKRHEDALATRSLGT